jgi:hypothetical protein
MDVDSKEDWANALTAEERQYWKLLTLEERQNVFELERTFGWDLNERVKYIRLTAKQHADWQTFHDSIEHLPPKKRRKAVLEKMEKAAGEARARLLARFGATPKSSR